MAELLIRVEELRHLNSAQHWFCDVRDTEQASEPQEDRKPTEFEISAEFRSEKISDCLQLFAYLGPEAESAREFLAEGIDRQLGRCDVCVVQYYKGKRSFLEKLASEYEDDDVAEFSNIMDSRDLDRIKRGLAAAAHTLRELPSAKRRMDALNPTALMALFEALSCEKFLQDDQLVRSYFVEPFELIRTNGPLKVTHYVPAATVFLFDPDQSLCLWAMRTWMKHRMQLSKEDFDFAVRDPLSRTLSLATSPSVDVNFVGRFWCGIKLIVEKLSPDLITHSLRAMEIDICKLTLEHLQHDAPGLRFLLQTIEQLLMKGPKDFWDAMGPISPTTFVEHVFNNPQYDRFLLGVRRDEEYETSALKDLLSWISPFMSSLQTSQKLEATRSLVFQLMDRLQAERFPKYAVTECYRIGLAVLTKTLENCIDDSSIPDNVRRVVAAATLEVTSAHISPILAILGLSRDSEKFQKLSTLCLRVVKSALKLECKSLRTDQDSLRFTEHLPHGFSIHSPAIWDAVVRHLDRGNVVLAKAALTGIIDLTGLEKFTINSSEAHNREKSGFNLTFGQLTHLASQILERINDFEPEHLDMLFQDPETAVALAASLFSADTNTYEAGVNLIKSISGESARREGIGHLLTAFFGTTLNSFSWSLRRISQHRTFAPCPRMLKTCIDVLDILCDSQTGLLRTRPISGISESKAVENFWKHLWEALKMVYEMTEKWSKQNSDRGFMQDFCRDVMQFSEQVFEQYAIFATSINSATMATQKPGRIQELSEENVSGKQLLLHPSETIGSMLKFLRLRDEYLASTCANLISKILIRLTELKMALPEKASDSLEQVIIGKIRTILPPQQKAEFARALEDNLGREVAMVEADIDSASKSRSQSAHGSTRESVIRTTPDSRRKPKVGTIDFDAWSAKSKAQRTIVDLSDDDEFGDADSIDAHILSVSASVELRKQQLAERAELQKASQRSSNIKNETPDRMSDMLKQQAALSFREKREKEVQAKKKRDAEALARVKRNIPLKGIAEQTLGEGSAIGNLGIVGKDHAPKGTGMMVSSGSDTNSDDEIDQELFGGSKAPRVSAAVRDYQRSKLQQLQTQGPVKKIKQQRSAKDMRARLVPDLSSLHRTILGWDFFHKGEFPQNSGRDDYTSVASKFRTPMDYQATFQPLLILEAWQGFVKSKEEGGSKTFEIKVANRLTVDSFIEVSTSMDQIDIKDLGLGEADVILISKAKSPAMNVDQPHCLARIMRITRKKGAIEISYRVNPGNDLVSAITPNASLYGVKVSSLTPLEREYGALLGLQYYDLCDEIIKAKASPLLKYTEKQIEPIASIYELNIAQAKAVKSALDNDAFTLIQGPPGSGKTKTIVATVGALLTSILQNTGSVAITTPQPTQQNGQIRNQAAARASKKLLICAPSNAAIDEIVMRLKNGVKTLSGTSHKLCIVRLGKSESINTNVKDVTLDELVMAKLNHSNGKNSNSRDDLGKAMDAHKAAYDEFNALMTLSNELKLKGEAQTPEMSRDFEVLKRKKQQLSNQIDLLRDNSNTAARDADISRRRAQQDILDNAHVICATLSGSGHDMFQNISIEFETVIIDEAAQSIELSALIPLKYGCSKCIMVGDPKQLPPTVLSREAAGFQFEQSLFVRMQANQPSDVHLLDTQYRMHPEISQFPSQAFYDGKLLDGKGMAKLRMRPWHQSEVLGPYRFFDVQGTHESAPKGHSLINKAEVQIALQLFNRLITDHKEYEFSGKVGIITPYKSQLALLRSRFAGQYGDTIFRTIEFNTTDAFQGRESEIIIFSCVRASSSKGIGFLSDIRRMNVGITRAKSSLWVLGNSQSLMQGEFWANLINDAKRRDKYTGGNLSDMLRNSSLPPEVAKRKQSVVIRDVEMTDAPVIGGYTKREPSSKPVLPDTKLFEASTNQDHKTSSNGQPSMPSHMVNKMGTVGNLNANKGCGWCGDTSHLTAQCSDEGGIKVGNSCTRCGKPGHRHLGCKVDRCLSCGEFGHIALKCASTTSLSKAQKEAIRRSEVAHEAQLKQAEQRVENKHKAPDVVCPPALDPRAAAGGQKRKRNLSPPHAFPKGPKLGHKDSRHRMRQVESNLDDDSAAFPIDPNYSQPRQPELQSARDSGDGPRASQPMPERRAQSATAGSDSPQDNMVTLDARLAVQPVFGHSADKFLQTNPGGVQPSNGTVARPPQMMKKKKKEVDPFIKPKPRHRR